MRRLALTLVLAGAVLVLVAGRIEMGPLAARLAASSLGRPVGIASLRITPGLWIRVELAGLRIGNRPGGSRPAMLELGQASAEIEAWSLLRGPPVIRALVVADAALLLERGADHVPNWRFGPASSGPGDRSGLLTLLTATIRRAEITLRTTGGRLLRTRIETADLDAAGPAAPIRLRAAGGYDAIPVTLAATIESFDRLRQAAVPVATELMLTAGADATLRFTGRMARPLDLDGAEGRLALRAPTAATLLALAGAEARLDAALALDGRIEHQGDLWRLTEGRGTLAGEAFTAPLLQLTEGRPGLPDAVAVELGLSRVDLDQVLARGRRDGAGNTDLPLAISLAPDPLLRLRLTIGDLAYAGLHGTDAQFLGALEPGRIELEAVAISTSGARLTGSGRFEATPAGGRGQAHLALEDGDLGRLREAFGLRDLPLSGRLDGRLSVAAEAPTLNEAARDAVVSAVIVMRQGRIAREVIELASTDARLLLRHARGTTAVSCLLGVLRMQAGIGLVAPLRIRSAEGEIAGTARFDLRRRQLDLVIGSQRSTTGFFALDIPVRVSGSFHDPAIRPARWSAEGRTRLATADAVAPLPAELRAFARANPCYDPG